MKAGYTAVTGGAVALSAATAKTVIGVKAHANSGVDLTYFEVSFDGVTASNVPVLVELCYCTWATNSPGTNSTSLTPVQLYGRVLAVGGTAGKTWTAEPTVLSVLDEFLLTPNGGIVKWPYAPGYTLDSALAQGFAIRCTAPDVVNVRATLNWERC